MVRLSSGAPETQSGRARLRMSGCILPFAPRAVHARAAGRHGSAGCEQADKSREGDDCLRHVVWDGTVTQTKSGAGSELCSPSAPPCRGGTRPPSAVHAVPTLPGPPPRQSQSACAAGREPCVFGRGQGVFGTLTPPHSVAPNLLRTRLWGVIGTLTPPLPIVSLRTSDSRQIRLGPCKGREID